MSGFLGRFRGSIHHYCQGNLSAFLDGQLPARERERVQQHLQACQACQWDLQTMQRTVELLRGLPQVKAPRSFRIPHTEPAPSLPVWLRPWAYGALRSATAAMAVLLAITLVGNALALPSYGAPRLMAAMEKGEVPAAMPAEDQGGATAEALGAEEPEVAAAAPPRSPHEGTPSTRGDEASETAVPEPHLLGRGGSGPEPTLSPEEAARKAAAPAGMGVGPEPAVPTPLPGVAAQEPTAAAESEGLGIMAAPSSERPAQPSMVPDAGLEAVPAGPEEQVDDATAAPEAQAQQLGLRPPAVREVRQQLAFYPWRQWTVVVAALLAVLSAATLWVRAARARWP